VAEIQPSVTAIAICFNHARFVVECLDSIRAQTHPRVQLIIVDDCSSDGSGSIIRQWLQATGTQATLIAHDQNRGICRSRNEALAVATGDYIACISTDDAWLPDKLAIQVAKFEELAPKVGVVYSDAYRVDEQGQPLPALFLSMCGIVDSPPEGNVYEELLEHNFVPSLASLVRRSCFDVVGGYDESLAFEDWDMWLRISQRFSFAYSPVLTARYRVVASSLWHELQGSRRAEFEESLLRIRLKHLGHTAEWDRRLISQLTSGAEKLYELDHPRCRHYLRDVTRIDRRRRTLALCVLAHLRLPYRRASRLVELISRRRRDAAASGTTTSS